MVNTQPDTTSQLPNPDRVLESIPVKGNAWEYMLQCILALAPETKQAVIDNALKQTIKHFGKDRHYLGGKDYNDIQSRNARIKHAYWRNGERVVKIAWEEKLCERQIWNIIKS
jgi:hypothetical protein